MKHLTEPEPPTKSSLVALAEAGDFPSIQHALLEGRDANERGPDGRTALHAALGEGRLDIVTVLLEHGGDVSAVDATGWSAMHWSASSNRREILEVAYQLHPSSVDVEDEEGGTPTAWAAQMNECVSLDWLIEHGADPNHRYRSGWSPLHRAAAAGSSQAMRLLIEAGAKAMMRLPPEQDEEFGHLASDLLRHYHPDEVDCLKMLEAAEVVEGTVSGAFD